VLTRQPPQQRASRSNAKRRKAKKVTSKLSFSFDDGDEADEEA